MRELGISVRNSDCVIIISEQRVPKYYSVLSYQVSLVYHVGFRAFFTLTSPARQSISHCDVTVAGVEQERWGASAWLLEHRLPAGFEFQIIAGQSNLCSMQLQPMPLSIEVGFPSQTSVLSQFLSFA